ncbi:interleukin-8-like, partial [Anarhichas minor]|uniref:interleukin-8-like n=1 Tax=Anarhichas minor TaxID=65739 RepID=UPI003F739967
FKTSGISPRDQGVVQRCRCISKPGKKPIGHYVGKVEGNPVSSLCRDIEIIVTPKKDGREICLDLNAPRVKKSA